jgi:hypothetical protein
VLGVSEIMLGVWGVVASTPQGFGVFMTALAVLSGTTVCAVAWVSVVLEVVADLFAIGTIGFTRMGDGVLATMGRAFSHGGGAAGLMCVLFLLTVVPFASTVYDM